MNERVKQTIVIALICLSISGISMNVSAKLPGPPVADVNVSNTPNVKVTNVPNVNVANTPDVNVVNALEMKVVNTPDVNVANTANVSVTNTPNVNVVNALDVNLANDTPIPVKASNVYRFSGFSKATLMGDSGIAALHTACQSSFGAGARMCTTKEIFETPSLSSILAGQGWVHPVVVSEIIDSSDKRIMRDFSGLSAAALSMSCDGWRSISTGIIYMASEGYRVVDCGEARHVSCCVSQ